MIGSGGLSERPSILSRIRFRSRFGIFFSASAADLLNSIRYFKGRVPHAAAPKTHFHRVHHELSTRHRHPSALLTRAGVSDIVELKLGDAIKGFNEKCVDAVILDLATPWLVVSCAYEALRGGGCFVSFSPTIEQVIKTVKALENDGGFIDIETIECISRRFQVKEGKTRPETLMIGHTGYITRARKVYR